MLRLRVITALALVIPFLLSLTVKSQLPFALFTLVFIAAAGWEWGRLNAAAGAGPVLMGVLLALACAAAVAADWITEAPSAAWWTATALWLVGGTVALRGGPAGWPHLPKFARWVLGLVALWVAWLAMGHARAIGINFMLSIFCLVWMADVAAYFGGRAFGKRKLAPSISPGKSWEGVWSGMAGVLLLAALWQWIDRTFGVDGPSLDSHLARVAGQAGMAVVLLVLCGFSVVGDLFESLVKRAAGAKDSSRLLPGHGGVLDRIDALLPVFPAALALAWM